MWKRKAVFHHWLFEWPWSLSYFQLSSRTFIQSCKCKVCKLRQLRSLKSHKCSCQDQCNRSRCSESDKKHSAPCEIWAGADVQPPWCIWRQTKQCHRWKRNAGVKAAKLCKLYCASQSIIFDMYDLKYPKVFWNETYPVVSCRSVAERCTTVATKQLLCVLIRLPLCSKAPPTCLLARAPVSWPIGKFAKRSNRGLVSNDLSRCLKNKPKSLPHCQWLADWCILCLILGGAILGKHEKT